LTLGEPEVLAFDVVGTPIHFETGMLGYLRGACGKPDSAASERFELQGPSVFALALRLGDAARVLSRAEALLCSVWRERVGAGERPIPAVRTPDDTLVHPVENPGRADARTIRVDDFHLLPDAATAPDGGAPARLDAVDHLSADSFADRFFVEIAERRGGYRQYGTANAAMRLAAQARRPPPAQQWSSRPWPNR
jgi:4-hydroxyphenylpyruvate dioxygenase-like putative hemolysin